MNRRREDSMRIKGMTMTTVMTQRRGRGGPAKAEKNKDASKRPDCFPFGASQA